MDKILTDEQKLYIKDSLDTQSLDEIAKNLQVDSEAVYDFIINESTDIITPEQIIGMDILKDLGILPNPVPYSINFQLTKTGDVEINVEWSIDANSEEFIENVGTLLHMIHNGKMKTMIGQNLTLLAKENDMEEECPRFQ